LEDINYIAKNFDLDVTSFAKKKSYYILNTDSGLYKLSKSLLQPENIEFMHEMKEHVSNSVNIETDRFLLSASGGPYFLNDDGLYTITRHKELRHSDFSDAPGFSNAVEAIAKLHKGLINIEFKSKKIYLATDIISDLENKFKRFEAVKKLIKQQRRLSDFDIYYIRNFDYYKNKIQKSIGLLKQTNITGIMSNAAGNNSVCHLLLKQENICLDKGRFYFRDFSEARVAPHIFDLIYIIDRYIKDLPKVHLSINEIISLYLKINPGLYTEGLKIIYPLMSFPNRYLKICDKYYSKKRTWAPVSMAKKMDYIINGYKAYLEYIDEIDL
jgi:spore coat protein I